MPTGLKKMLITIISRVLHALLGLGEQVCGNRSLKERTQEQQALNSFT